MTVETIISHPRTNEDDILLESHLEDTAIRMRSLGRFSTRGDPSEATVANIIARLHDFGKVTPAFQAYVRGEYSGPRQETYHARLGALAAFWVVSELGGETRDALSAFTSISRHHGALPELTSHVLHDTCNAETKDDRIGWATDQIRQIDAEPVHQQAANDLLETAGNETTTWKRFSGAVIEGDLYETLADTVSERVGVLSKEAPEKLPPKIYDRTLRYWGALLLADKTSAGEIDRTALRREPLALETLEQYIETLETDDELEQELNKWRERARTTAPTAAVARLLDDRADVGKLTLPTGLGKTFTGITTAFTLRDEIADRRGLATKPTVVYALPYTSIIEQTRELFENPKLWNADPTGHTFTVHHYLSETVTRVDSERDPEDGQAETDVHTYADSMLGEAWRSGTVLTTFVQLFESVAGPTNSRGLKLSTLQDAVIVLDEPQALPKRWWDAIPRLVELLCDEFNATVIAMTATQPAIFRDSDLEAVEILDDVDEYYKQARRVRYEIDESVWNLGQPGNNQTSIDHETAGKRIVESIQSQSSRTSVLAICNTIASSRRLTETVIDAADRPTTHVGVPLRNALIEIEQSDVGNQSSGEETHTSETESVTPDVDILAGLILEQLGLTPNAELSEATAVTDVGWQWCGEEEPPLFVATFNSRYRPKDRRVLIRLVEAMTTTDVPFVLVATQAVEAGVDVSFSRVFRDLAPLDSVVQAAGRCNRSFEWGESGGYVTVWLLDDPEEPDGRLDRTPASYVYGSEPGGHLSLIAKTLRETLSQRTNVDELELTRTAVPEYFDRIQRKTIANVKLREHIEQFDARALRRTSLIRQEYPTVDVLVGITDREQQLLETIGDCFSAGDLQRAYNLLQEASDLRISIPARDGETALKRCPRVDRRERSDSEGVSVLAYTPEIVGGSYELDFGGFVADSDDVIGGRFTVL